MNELGNIDLSLQFCLKFLRNEDKILDIGCNYGSLLNKISNNSFNNLYGIDVNKINIEKGLNLYPKLKHKLKHYFGEKIPFDNESFDKILMFDVLEHIPEIQIYLSNEVKRVMKKNSILIIQTPNKYTNIPWEIVQHKNFKYKKYHCSLQSYYSLKKLLQDCGFQEITFHYMPVNDNYNSLIKNTTNTFFVFLYKMINLLPLRLRTNFWVTAKKP